MVYFVVLRWFLFSWIEVCVVLFAGWLVFGCLFMLGLILLLDFEMVTLVVCRSSLNLSHMEACW